MEHYKECYDFLMDNYNQFISPSLYKDLPLDSVPHVHIEKTLYMYS